MSGIKRETIIRVILGICMIFVSIGMIYGKSKAGNADEKGRTYIEESEKTAKQKNTEKSRKDSTESTKADSTIKAQMTEAQQLSDTESKGIAEAEAVEDLSAGFAVVLVEAEAKATPPLSTYNLNRFPFATRLEPSPFHLRISFAVTP